MPDHVHFAEFRHASNRISEQRRDRRSPTSGRDGMSSGGRSKPRRPGEPSSNTSCSFSDVRLRCVVGSFESLHECVDLRSRLSFPSRKPARRCPVRDRTFTSGKPGTMFFLSNSLMRSGRPSSSLTTNSLKRGAGKSTCVTCSSLDLQNRVVRLLNVLLGDLAQSFRTQRRQVDCRHQRAQRLVRADVRCRLLAPDVLFARGKRQDEGSLSFLILAHADEPSGHLPDKLLTRCQKSHMRAAETHGNAQRLSFTDNDVGVLRRLQDTQRQCFADIHDRERTMRARGQSTSTCLRWFRRSSATESRPRRRFRPCACLEFVKIDASGRQVVDELNLDPEVPRIGRHDSAIFRMDRLRNRGIWLVS